MTGRLAKLFNFINNSIQITIYQNFFYDLKMLRSFTFKPELAPRPAPEMSFAGFKGLQPGLFINIGHHQDITRLMVLGDSGQQPLAL